MTVDFFQLLEAGHVSGPRLRIAAKRQGQKPQALNYCGLVHSQKSFSHQRDTRAYTTHFTFVRKLTCAIGGLTGRSITLISRDAKASRTRRHVIHLDTCKQLTCRRTLRCSEISTLPIRDSCFTQPEYLQGHAADSRYARRLSRTLNYCQIRRRTQHRLWKFSPDHESPGRHRRMNVCMSGIWWNAQFLNGCVDSLWCFDLCSGFGMPYENARTCSNKEASKMHNSLKRNCRLLWTLYGIPRMRDT